MLSDHDKSRLRWMCRRGMLELDVMFERFIENGYEQLSTHEREVFENLLDESDPQLFRWVLGFEVPDDQEFLSLMIKIREAPLPK